MRIVSGVLSALAIVASIGLFSSGAFAADDEGKIAKVDPEGLTITLENGNTYKLSGEFDVEALQPGTEVVLAYDTIEGEKTVTDLVTYE